MFCDISMMWRFASCCISIMWRFTCCYLLLHFNNMEVCLLLPLVAYACCYLLLHFNNVEVCLLLQVTTRLCAFHPGRLTSTSGSTLSTTTKRTTTIWVSTSIMIAGPMGHYGGSLVHLCQFHVVFGKKWPK